MGRDLAAFSLTRHSVTPSFGEGLVAEGAQVSHHVQLQLEGKRLHRQDGPFTSDAVLKAMLGLEPYFFHL
jgi:hypothetical protein